VNLILPLKQSSKTGSGFREFEGDMRQASATRFDEPASVDQLAAEHGSGAMLNVQSTVMAPHFCYIFH
jgi:hypothetical protein